MINYLSHISPSLSDSIDLRPPYLQEGGLQWRIEKRKASMQQLCKSLTSLSLSASTLVLLLLDQQGCSVHGLQKFSRESRIASHCCEYSVPCNHISVLWIREQSVLHCSASRYSASRFKMQCQVRSAWHKKMSRCKLSAGWSRAAPPALIES